MSMKMIVGLGNPGIKYANTRHNMGFMATDALIRKLEPAEKTFWENNKGLKSEIKQINSSAGGRTSPILLAKPTTFMNNSGFAVAAVAKYYKVASSDLVVIHDDLDLPLGKIRVRFGGGAGGHKGVESVIERLGTDKFLRIRLGIGSPKRIKNFSPREALAKRGKLKIKNSRSVDDYVLSPFQSSERGKVKTCLRDTVRTVDLILKHGIEKYMGKYNRN